MTRKVRVGQLTACPDTCTGYTYVYYCYLIMSGAREPLNSFASDLITCTCMCTVYLSTTPLYMCMQYYVFKLISIVHLICRYLLSSAMMILIVILLIFLFSYFKHSPSQHSVYKRKIADSATASHHRLSLQKHYKNTSLSVQGGWGESFFISFFAIPGGQKLLLLVRRENMVEITREREEAMSDRATEVAGVEMTQDCYLILRNRQ